MHAEAHMAITVLLRQTEISTCLWQDCEMAVSLAPGAHKPAFRRIQALRDLGLLEVRQHQQPMHLSQPGCCSTAENALH